MRHKTVALIGVAAVATLLWPGPASGDTTLGGYSGVATADAIHIEVIDPVIPLPSDPQVDVGVAYTKSQVDTGPVTRATASYLWPGDVLGDGFGQLTGNPDQAWPIQIDSKYPATAAAPAKNLGQITDGNGMYTSTNGDTTKASVTGLGIAGKNTNLLGGIGAGLSKLFHAKKPVKPIDLAPVQVSNTLAGIATVRNVTSDSTATVGAKTFTTSAHTAASDIDILGGLISIKGFDMSAQSVSDGTKAVNTGHAEIGGIGIAKNIISLDDKGLNIAGGLIKLPALPDVLVNSLKQIGIQVQTMAITKNVDGATGSFEAQGLVITVDTKPLRAALDAPFGILSQIINLLPSNPLTQQLSSLLNLAPKFVITIGDVSTSATAAPAYVGPGGSVPPPTGPTGCAGCNPGTGPVSSGGGIPVGGGSVPPVTTPTTPAQPGSIPTTIEPAALQLPGLASIPRLVILAGLVLAALGGWLFRALGGFLFGAGRSCAYGLASGVPDLRKG